MALQVLPVRGRVRFLLLAHPAQVAGSGLQSTYSSLPPRVAHNRSQTRVSSAGPQPTDVQVSYKTSSAHKQCVRFGPVGGRQEPFWQLRLQQSPEVLQEAPSGRHGDVVVVEVVLVDVEVVGVSVVEVVGVSVVEVAGVWHVPLTQTRLPQHWSFRVQCLPARLQPGGSAPASPMPSDASVPPTRAAPINLRALPRVMLPSASPLASSSKKPSSLAIGAASSHKGGALLPHHAVRRPGYLPKLALSRRPLGFAPPPYDGFALLASAHTRMPLAAATFPECLL